MPHDPSNQTGRPVRNDDFYDRIDFSAKLWERIDGDRANILLLAPRRVGKSSLMFHLADHAAEHGFVPLMLSVADAADETAVIRVLLKALHEHQDGDLKKRIRAAGEAAGWLKRLKKVSVAGTGFELADDVAADWRVAGDTLIHCLDAVSSRWLILIDELPIFVLRLIQKDSTGQRAGQFLDWFRELRIGPRAPQQVQWFLAGSIGLDTVTRRVSLGDKINDLHTITNFGPFDRKTAAGFLQSLARHYKLTFDKAAIKQALDRIGWLIPFHLQLVFSEIRDIASRGDTITPAVVAQAYEALLSNKNRARFDWWIQRLARELPDPFSAHALVLLDAAAQDPDGATRSTLTQILSTRIADPDQRQSDLEFLLNVLVTDGYLVRKSGRYLFLSPVLREFWKRTRLEG